MRETADNLAAILHTYGYETSIAYSSSAALRLATDRSPDVAVLDLGAGPDIAVALRQQCRNIILIGFYDPAVGKRGGRSIDYHLKKPMNIMEMTMALGRGRRKKSQPE